MILGMSVPVSTVLKTARSFLGIVEATGHNDGAAVHDVQSTTGAYNAPWCASLVQTVLKRSGVGTYADDSAGVFYILGYARKHGDERDAPLPGRLVAFEEGGGHIGIVETVNGDGTYNTIEGNYNNRCERVRRHLGANHARFIEVPGMVRMKPLITPAFYNWAEWKLGRGTFAGKKPADPALRPKGWRPAIPAAYFVRLEQLLAAERKPVVKPAVKPVASSKKPGPTPLPSWYDHWKLWRLGGRTWPRPHNAPKVIPLWAWKRLAIDKKGK